jgi:uncharacterized repeat protein (TIGR01451 family)
MSLIRRRKANVTTRRAGVLRKSVAQLAVLGLMATGVVAALAGTGSAIIIEPLCNQQEATSQSGGVEICKTGPETAVAGTDITYTLEINAWGSWNKNFTVHDDLTDEGAPLSLVSVTPSSNVWDCSESADPEVICNAPDTDPEDVDGTTITVVAHVDSAFVPTEENSPIENCATVERSYVVTDAVDESGNSGDESCWWTDITRESDISVVKTGPASLVVPNNVVYTITATNNGPSDSDPVTIEDPLPTGTTLVSAIGDAWDCTGSPVDTLTCSTIDGLASGASASLTVTLKVPATQAGVDLKNCASVTSGDTSDITDNDTSCTTIVGSAVTLVEAAQAAAPITGVAPHFTG